MLEIKYEYIEYFTKYEYLYEIKYEYIEYFIKHEYL